MESRNVSFQGLFVKECSKQAAKRKGCNSGRISLYDREIDAVVQHSKAVKYDSKLNESRGRTRHCESRCDKALNRKCTDSPIKLCFLRLQEMNDFIGIQKIALEYTRISKKKKEINQLSVFLYKSVKRYLQYISRKTPSYFRSYLQIVLLFATFSLKSDFYFFHFGIKISFSNSLTADAVFPSFYYEVSSIFLVVPSSNRFREHTLRSNTRLRINLQGKRLDKDVSKNPITRSLYKEAFSRSLSFCLRMSTGIRK